jgi:hypothetical protein
VGVVQRTLGTHDALRDRRLGDEERPCDLVGGQAAEQAQRQRDPRLGRQHRVAGDEDQPQQVVADRVVERLLGGFGDELLVHVDLAAELLVFLLGQLEVAQPVERAVLRRGHQPGTGVVGHPLLRPALERGHQRVLRELLGAPDVAHQAGDAGDDARRLDAPDGLDRSGGWRCRSPAGL